VIGKSFFHFIRGWGDSHDIYPNPLPSRCPKQNILAIMRDIVLHLRVQSRLHLPVRTQSSEPLVGSGLTMIGFPFPSTPNLRNCRNARGSNAVSRRYQMGATLPKSDPVHQYLVTCRRRGCTNSIFLMIESPDSSLRLGLEES